MRAVIQRVSEAAVAVEGRTVGSVDVGVLVLLAVVDGDEPSDAAVLADKIAHLRIFADDEGRMNRSVIDAGGGALVVSQFTLAADVRRGRRPSFTAAADPDVAAPMVERFADELRTRGVPTDTGSFGAMMDVALVNDGPVTIVVDVVDGSIR